MSFLLCKPLFASVLVNDNMHMTLGGVVEGHNLNFLVKNFQSLANFLLLFMHAFYSSHKICLANHFSLLFSEWSLIYDLSGCGQRYKFSLFNENV
jgi:hypothetical protein